MSLYTINLNKENPRQELTWLEVFVHDHDGTGYVTKTSSLSPTYSHLIGATFRMCENAIGWPIRLRERGGTQKMMDLFFEVTTIRATDGPAKAEQNKPKRERFPASEGWIWLKLKIAGGWMSPSRALNAMLGARDGLQGYEIGLFEHHSTVINMAVRPYGSPPRDLVNANN